MRTNRAHPAPPFHKSQLPNGIIHDEHRFRTALGRVSASPSASATSLRLPPGRRGTCAFWGNTEPNCWNSPSRRRSESLKADIVVCPVTQRRSDEEQESPMSVFAVSPPRACPHPHAGSEKGDTSTPELDLLQHRTVLEHVQDPVDSVPKNGPPVPTRAHILRHSSIQQV